MPASRSPSRPTRSPTGRAWSRKSAARPSRSPRWCTPGRRQELADDQVLAVHDSGAFPRHRGLRCQAAEAQDRFPHCRKEQVMKLIVIAVASALALGACAQNQQRGATAPTEAERDTRNAALTGKVKSALAADVGLKTLTNIDVDSAGTVVTLKGKVDTDDQKRRAQEVASSVSGVTSVNNQLT